MAKFAEVSIQADLDLRDPLIISISDFNGPRLDVRHFYRSEEGEMGPTKKGINVPLDNILPLIDTILTAYNESTGSRLAVIEVEEEE